MSGIENVVGEQWIRHAYALLLGREPEEGAPLGHLAMFSTSAAIKSFLASAEFFVRVAEPLLKHRRPAGYLFDLPPADDLRSWAASTLVSPETSAAEARASRNWIALYHAVLPSLDLDPALVGALSFSWHDLIAALRDLVAKGPGAFIGSAVEEITSTEVRGWTADFNDPGRAVTLKLMIGGRLIGVGQADHFRRDLQDRFGGSGCYGFVLPLPPDLPRGGHAEIRVLASDEVLARIALPDLSGSRDALALREHVRTLRQGLDRLETALPELDSKLAIPFDRYADYAELYYQAPAGQSDRRGRSSDSALVKLAVVVDLAGADLEAADAMLDAVWALRDAVHEVILMVPEPETGGLEEDLLRRHRWRSPVPVRRIDPQGPSSTRWAAAAVETTADHLLVVPSRFVVAPSADVWFARALASTPRACLIYADSDRLDLDTGERDEPQLRTGFDPDLLRQVPFIDGSFAVTAALLKQGAAPAVVDASVGPSALALALDRQGVRIIHLTQVLSSVVKGPSAEPRSRPWRDVVAATLARDEPEARVEAYADSLGAQVPDAVTIRRPALIHGVTATIIIPSRDNAALLEAAIASLQAARRHNRVQAQVVVVDNGSTEPRMLALLERLTNDGVHVRRHDVPFNWALLNNAAADKAEGDFLVFLNDDILVLAQDWLDRLGEQAMRPEVGAVGTRLIYAEGLIQHAGFVMRKPGAMWIHEGVGAPASDPGYLGRNALTRRVLAVTGACLATRAAVFRELGGFDSTIYPVEGNDVDYCLRVNESGRAVVYEPQAALCHKESMSRGFNLTREKARMSQRAQAALARRWSKLFPSDPSFNGHFSSYGRPFVFFQPPPSLRSQDLTGNGVDGITSDLD